MHLTPKKTLDPLDFRTMALYRMLFIRPLFILFLHDALRTNDSFLVSHKNM